MTYIINLLLIRCISMENQEISEQTTENVPVSDATEQAPDEPQQTSTDTTAAQQQPQAATDKYLYMIPSGIAMYVIPKELIGKYNYKELTGGNAKDKNDFEVGTRNATKEPKIEHTATATYDFEELQKLFKVVKALGAEHITISLKTDEPVKITATNDEGESIAYWLAPYMTQ